MSDDTYETAKTAHIDEHPETKRFVDEHQALWQYVSSIKETEDLAQARKDLESITELLPGHLTMEEGPGGVFDAMRAASDRLDDVLERLEIDHRRMRRIMVKLPLLRDDPEELREIKSFALYLEVHEARERQALEVARGNG